MLARYFRDGELLNDNVPDVDAEVLCVTFSISKCATAVVPLHYASYVSPRRDCGKIGSRQVTLPSPSRLSVLP